MALALRLRRASVVLSSAAIKDRPISSLTPSSSSSSSPSAAPLALLSTSAAPLASLTTSAAVFRNPSFHPPFLSSSRSFQSSAPLSDRPRSDFGSDITEIGMNEILFEGCDYNHWLITMDFPKDPKPTPEEMVETYVQTLAKVVGSVEEAKKRMYACSTTTYHGFQAVMTEEMSEKFRGLPGVVFILPDSYIDPVNKQYGGDKYDNGVITPRPPPIQYERRGRYNDQNRRYNQPRYDGPRDTVPTQQGSMPPDQQVQGDGRGYAPQQNYGPPRQEGRGYAPQQSYGPPRQDGGAYAPQQNYGPPRQDGRGYAPQQNYSPPGQDGRGFGPPGGSFRQEERRDNLAEGAGPASGQNSPGLFEELEGNWKDIERHI